MGLYNAITTAGMDVGIVNCREMLMVDEVEPDLKVLCENLVFNKTPDATEHMLERTTYEKAVVTAKKNGTKPPKKPRVIVEVPRKKFAYDGFVPKPALEPPAPSSKYAQEKIPRDYAACTTHDQ